MASHIAIRRIMLPIIQNPWCDEPHVMKKSEMEEHHAAYHAHMAVARTAERDGLYRAAVDSAMSAWEFIDGMMRYEQKYLDREFASVPAIDFVLKYSPMLLDVRRLNALRDLLKSRKRIDRDASADLVEELERAIFQTSENYQLWSFLERHPDVRQDELPPSLGGDREYRRTVIRFWEQLGIVSRTPDGRSYRLLLIAPLGRAITGKCPSCGQTHNAPKRAFFEPIDCPSCGKQAHFVLVASEGNPQPD